MRIQSFLGKVSVESLHQMDNHINQWLADHAVEPQFITQSFGYEHPQEGRGPEPVIVTSVWY